jgi:hypothetical protein
MQRGRITAARPQAQHSTERLAIVVEHHAMQATFGEALTATGEGGRSRVCLKNEAQCRVLGEAGFHGHWASNRGDEVLIAGNGSWHRNRRCVTHCKVKLHCSFRRLGAVESQPSHQIGRAHV